MASTFSYATEFLMAGDVENYEMHLNGSAGARFIPVNGQYLDSSSYGAYVGGWHMFSGRVSGGNGTVRVDKVDGGSGTSSQSSGTTALVLGERGGGSLYFQGDMAEVLIFNRALTTQERTRVEGYLAGKYAIGTTAAPMDLGYGGYYNHSPSGLNLTLYRAYDPNTARWLSRDPKAEGTDATLYSYVFNDPAKLRDPLGLFGVGVQDSASAEAGNINSGGGATGQVGSGLFVDNESLSNVTDGSFASGGAFAGTPSANLQYPGGTGQTPWALGASAGGGVGLFATNADNVCQLYGPFHQYNLNLLFGSISIAYDPTSGSPDNPFTWTAIVSITVGKGGGASVSGYSTTTAVSNPGKCNQ